MIVLKQEKNKLRQILFGGQEKTGLLKAVPFYFIFICAGFVYLYPLIGAVITSFMSPDDLVNPTVTWIVNEIYLGNYVQAIKTLDFGIAILNSFLMSLIPALLQTMAAAVVGFGLARFKFPFKNIITVLMVAVFFMPNQVLLIPRYLLFDNLNLLNNVLSVYLPALLGQGLSSSVFILVYMQFFKSYPLAFDEAADLDGASKVKIFGLIALPLAKSATVLSLLFSFVWYWNETAQSNLFFGAAFPTLPMLLQQFNSRFESMFGGDVGAVGSATAAVSMAGTILVIAPILVIYIVLQKQFTESIERSGITGE